MCRMSGGSRDARGRMAGTIELARPGDPTTPGEAKKAKFVRKAAALAAEALDAAERIFADRVVGEFYEHVPPADVAGRSARFGRERRGLADELCLLCLAGLRRVALPRQFDRARHPASGVSRAAINAARGQTLAAPLRPGKVFEEARMVETPAGFGDDGD